MKNPKIIQVFRAPKKRFPGVMFNKKELGLILVLYGRMVAMGEWRDYGISSFLDYSEFSIYKKTSESAIYKVQKYIANSPAQKSFSAVGFGGKVLRQGHDLQIVLKVFETRKFKLVQCSF